MSWGRALAFWFEAEGGEVNHPDDPGKLTKFGISQRFNPDVDVANLTERGAARILFNRYWCPFGPNEMEPFAPLTAWAFFDFLANADENAASKCLQRIVLAFSDGDVGPKTLKAIREAVKRFNDAEIATRLIRARTKRTVDRVRSGDSDIAFLSGWMDRFVHLAAEINREAR